MALFGFGKKKEEAPCCCQSGGTQGGCCSGSGESAVKVLGSGCKNCHTLLEHTKEALASMGLPVEVDYVTDLEKIMGYGVMQMPALVVNEKVVSMGKVLTANEVEELLRRLGL